VFNLVLPYHETLKRARALTNNSDAPCVLFTCFWNIYIMNIAFLVFGAPPWGTFALKVMFIEDVKECFLLSTRRRIVMNREVYIKSALGFYKFKFKVFH
jgi:hypothetical protein